VITRLNFTLPAALEAGEPAEARGLTRDAVRMMVASRSSETLVHSTFSLLALFLEPGDLVVINTSGTIPAAFDAAGGGVSLVIHLSTHLGGDLFVVEPRHPGVRSTERWESDGPPPPAHLSLGEAGARMELLEPYLGSTRLWVARLQLPDTLHAWLAVHGRPIRYGYVEGSWPSSAYQNVYANEPGSAEMPSAGRPFTTDIITRLVAKGVGVAPVVLHTGVASLEREELPYPERVRVPSATARWINATREGGGRVIAVGTTVVRALESAVQPLTGVVQPFDGWTDVVVTPERPVRSIDGLLTGWHEPEASHLLMLEAIAGRSLLERSYEESLKEGYLFHEFGDVHLIVP
jgi:S-adenosylmethionine:tRNA ribosyltransferase-isomerase